MKKIINLFKMPSKSDFILHVAIIGLAVFGFVMVISASMGLSIGDNRYLVFTGAKLAIFTFIGYMGMVFCAKHFTFEKVAKNSMILMFGTIIALMACLLFAGSGGAKAWIRLPIPGREVTIQPSEFAKIIFMIILATYLGDDRKKYDSWWEFVKIPVCFVLICVCIVWFLQSDFGSAVVLFLIAVFCYLIPRKPILRISQYLLVMLGIIGIIGVVLMLYTKTGENIIYSLPFQQYQINRILSSINPFIDEYNTGYQLINGLVAFATGGLFGKGFGNSVRKYTDFPASNTDFILAIVVEELGFVCFLVIAIGYLTIIFVLFKYAFRIRSEKAKIVLVGVAMYMFIHFLFNVGGVTGFIPLTGVPLLMISAGGSSTTSLMMAIGIAQAIISQYRKGLIV